MLLLGGEVVVDYAFQTPPTRAELQRQLDAKDASTRQHAQRLIKILDRDGKLRDSYTYPVQAVRFGEGLTMLLLGGEVVVDYALYFKGKYGPDTTWVAGYSNDVFGYVPSVRVLKEGGYEGGGAMLFSSLPGPFAESVEKTIVDQAARVVGETRK